MRYVWLMKRTRLFASLAAALTGAALLSGCATQPDPCTPEWVEWKSDQIFDQFASSNIDTIRALQRVSGDIDNPGPLLAIQLATLADDFTDLAQDFDRIVLPELNDAIDQCAGSQEFMPAFSSFLRDEGVGEDVIVWIEALGYVAMEQRRR